MAVKSSYPDVSIPEVSWKDFVYQNFESYGDKTAIVDGCSGVSYTYSQLYDLTRKYSSALTKRGICKGDVIALFCPNLLEYPLILFAVTSLGAIVTSINPLCTSEELAKQLTDSGSKYVFTVPELLQKSRKACARARLAGSHIFIVGEAKGYDSLSTLLDKESVSEATPNSVASSDVALLQYSSGITDLPKGVLLTHRNLVAGCSIASVKGTFDFDGTSVVLGILPFFHSFSTVAILSLALHHGGKVICIPSIKQEAILEKIEQHKVTHAPLVPPMISELAQNPGLDECALSSIVCIFSGGSKLRQETVKKLKLRLPHINDIRQGYGMTEIGSVSHLCPMLTTNEDKPDSVGVLLPNMECKVVNVETGEILQADKDGELHVRGPTVMKGYFNNPEATALTIDNEGWLRTGDIGHYDNDGYFYIVNRLDEIITWRGFQILPHELENILISHPDIEDAAVVGLPEIYEGEEPKAFVVKGDCALTEDEVASFVSEKVKPFKQLRSGVEFIAEIPKSFSGKVLRRLLQEREFLRLLNDHEIGENESDEECQEKETTSTEGLGVVSTTPVAMSIKNELQDKPNDKESSKEENSCVTLVAPVVNSKQEELQDEPNQLNDQSSNTFSEQTSEHQSLRTNSADTSKTNFEEKANNNQSNLNHSQSLVDSSKTTKKPSQTCVVL